MGTPPEDAARRAELDRVLERGMFPIVEENGKIRPVFPPGMLLFRQMHDFRYELRSSIAGVPWGEACARCSSEPSRAELHKGNLLMWGYKALMAEREAEGEFTAMASDFAVAAEAANALAFALGRDERHHRGVPLVALRKDKAALYIRHVETLGQAFQRRTKLAADVLKDFCFRWIERMDERGAFAVDAEVSNRRRYDPSSLSTPDFMQIAHALLAGSELAGWLLEHGIIAVIRSQRQGKEGRLPAMLDAWLVQQGRAGEQRIGPQKLARLLIAHKLAAESDDVEYIRRRLEKAARRHPAPVRLDKY